MNIQKVIFVNFPQWTKLMEYFMTSSACSDVSLLLPEQFELDDHNSQNLSKQKRSFVVSSRKF